MNWYDAYDYCESLDGYLAEVTNLEIQSVLEAHATNLSPTNWWLGATDNQVCSLIISQGGLGPSFWLRLG